MTSKLRAAELPEASQGQGAANFWVITSRKAV